MISLDVTGRNFEVDSRMKDYLDDKIGGLDKYLPRQHRATAAGSVILADDTSGHENNRFVAEVMITVGGEKFFAKEGTINIYAAIDIVDAKLKSQLRTFKDKLVNAPRRARMLGRLIGRTSETDPLNPESATEL